ncbi:MAG TPA: thiamine-phosphate kinase [Azospira sp.]|nr:thiamine-phosphate kinase [Azospira sp.]
MPSASEFALIDRYFAGPTPGAVLGPGDDCALLQPSPGMQLAVTTDMLVAGTHFFPDTEPEALGWKTLAVNLSDLAAMGARPRWVLLAGSLPKADEAWLAAFAKGFFALAKRAGVDVVGGDTTRGPLNLCVTALGEVAPGKALRRDGAQPGDDLWVSGQPGLAALGLAQLQGKIELPAALVPRCLNALHRPQPRIALGLALVRQQLASAAIDVSDGLLADVAHIAERSGVELRLNVGQLPLLPKGVDPLLAQRCQLAGGDDYELAFTAPVAKRMALAALAADLELPLWRIGSVAEGSGVSLYDGDGAPLPPAFMDQFKGYDHFRAT